MVIWRVVEVLLVLITVLGNANGALPMRFKAAPMNNSTSRRDTFSGSSSAVNNSEPIGFQFKTTPGLAGGFGNFQSPEIKTKFKKPNEATQNDTQVQLDQKLKTLPSQGQNKMANNLNLNSPFSNNAMPEIPTLTRVLSSPAPASVSEALAQFNDSEPSMLSSILKSSTPSSYLDTLPSLPLKNISSTSMTFENITNISTSANNLIMNTIKFPATMFTLLGQEPKFPMSNLPIGFINQPIGAFNTATNDESIKQSDSTVILTEKPELIPGLFKVPTQTHDVSSAIMKPMNKQKIFDFNGINLGQPEVQSRAMTALPPMLMAGEPSIPAVAAAPTVKTPLFGQVKSPVTDTSPSESPLSMTQLKEETGLETKMTLFESTNTSSSDIINSKLQTPSPIISQLVRQRLQLDKMSQFDRLFLLNNTTEKSHSNTVESTDETTRQKEVITSEQSRDATTAKVNTQRTLGSSQKIQPSDQSKVLASDTPSKYVQDNNEETRSNIQVITSTPKIVEHSSKEMPSLLYQDENTTPIFQDHTTWKAPSLTDETTLQSEIITSSQNVEVMFKSEESSNDYTTLETSKDSVTTETTYQSEVITSTQSLEKVSEKTQRVKIFQSDNQLPPIEQPEVIISPSIQEFTTWKVPKDSTNDMTTASQSEANTSTQYMELLPLKKESLETLQPSQQPLSQADKTEETTQPNQDPTNQMTKEFQSKFNEEATLQKEIKFTQKEENLSEKLDSPTDQDMTTTAINPENYTTRKVQSGENDETSLYFEIMTQNVITTEASEETKTSNPYHGSWKDSSSGDTTTQQPEEIKSTQNIEQYNASRTVESIVNGQVLSYLNADSDDAPPSSTKSIHNDISSSVETPEHFQPKHDVAQVKPSFQCVATVPRLNLDLEKMLGVWYPAKLSKTTSKLWGQSLRNEYNITSEDCLWVEYTRPPDNRDLEFLNVFLRIGNDSTQVDALFVGDDKHPKESKWAISWPNGEDTLTSVVAAGVIGKERNRYTWLLTVDCDLNGIVEPDWAVMARIPEGISNSTLTTILAIVEGLKGLTVEDAITFQSDDCHK